MKPTVNPTRSVLWQYALGALRALAGMAAVVGGLSLTLVLGTFFRLDNSKYNPAETIQLMIFVLMTACGGLLTYNGLMLCRITSTYRKLSDAMKSGNREDINAVAAATGRSVTEFIRDLQRLSKRGILAESGIDCARGEFVLKPDNLPAPAYKDGDIYFSEERRLSLKPLIALPAVFAAYFTVRPYWQWYDAAVAGVMAVAVMCYFAVKTPKVTVLKEKEYKAPPPPGPVSINTGNEALDDFLTSSMEYLGELNGLSLSVTGEKMLLPVGELLNTTRQIFAFVEKNPEKIRQIRGFMNYYLPTTIKLLKSYRDFSRQPLKGENIKESMTKIEDSMSGIVETFRLELDNLYSDKALDITLDIDMMLAMMRQRDISDGSGGMDKKGEL